MKRPTSPSTSTSSRASGFFALLVALVVAAGSLFAQDAAAAGSMKLQSSTLPETGGAWHLFTTLELPTQPPTAHVPIRFIFTKTAAYELDLVDGQDKPVDNKATLGNQLPTIESQDVDFSDGTGRIFKKTRFDFTITRTRGYGPGEYRLQVKTADGVEIGGIQTVVLNRSADPNDPNSKLDIVDRRSLSFEKKSGPAKVSNVVGDGGVAGTQGESAVPQNGDISASGTATPFIPQSAYQPTPEELGSANNKGCGCSVPGTQTQQSLPSGLAGLGGGLGLALVLVMRRRKRQRP
jgi:hypothetical protein